MKLWLFTFTQPDRCIVSARVAAPDRMEACAVIGAALSRPLVSQANTHPEPGTILVALGEIEADQSHVVSILRIDGTVEVAQ